MIEVRGNLWTYPADVRIITTNGFIKKNGEAVMGRGCAFEATQKFPSIAKDLGTRLLREGNHVHVLGLYGGDILLSFPVKQNWYEKALPHLIRQSAKELALLVTDLPPERVWVLPRPGCGNGQLTWEEVKPLLADLPDNVHVITF